MSRLVILFLLWAGLILGLFSAWMNDPLTEYVEYESAYVSNPPYDWED